MERFEALACELENLALRRLLLPTSLGSLGHFCSVRGRIASPPKVVAVVVVVAHGWVFGGFIVSFRARTCWLLRRREGAGPLERSHRCAIPRDVEVLVYFAEARIDVANENLP